MKKVFYFCSIALLSSLSLEAAENKQHFPGVFVGATHSNSETEFTLGIEYEYRFNDLFGLGAVYEKTNNAHHGDGTTVKLASLYYHPDNHWRFGLGAGEEKLGGAHPHSETLFRASAGYDFHFDEFGIAPTLSIDFIDDDQAYVFGIAITKPF